MIQSHRGNILKSENVLENSTYMVHDIFASFAGVPNYLYDLFLNGGGSNFFNALSGSFWTV